MSWRNFSFGVLAVLLVGFWIAVVVQTTNSDANKKAAREKQMIADALLRMRICDLIKDRPSLDGDIKQFCAEYNTAPIFHQ